MLIALSQTANYGLGAIDDEMTPPLMERLEDIAERLRRLRVAYGFPHARAWCQFVGIGETSWNTFERGHRRITVDEALKLCAKTGVSLDWIYRGVEGNMPLHILQKLADVPVAEIELTDKRRRVNR